MPKRHKNDPKKESFELQSDRNSQNSVNNHPVHGENNNQQDAQFYDQIHEVQSATCSNIVNLENRNDRWNSAYPYGGGYDDLGELHGGWNTDNHSELIHRHHRTTSIHRNATVRDVNENAQRTFPRSLEERRNWVFSAGYTMHISRTSMEQKAYNIVQHMEQDIVLMEDTPESAQLRREALRDMPQCLTVKRIIKKKLKNSVTHRSKGRPIGFWKRLKYHFSMKLSQLTNSFKSVTYSLELWYSSLKTIEGHFGSGVATYFKFFRWLFIMNCIITSFVFSFIIVPQLLHVHIVPIASQNQDVTTTDQMAVNNISIDQNKSYLPPEMLLGDFKRRSDSLQNAVSFKFEDIFTGEGYLTNTTLFYGYYTNGIISLLPNMNYSMPYAYFFTMFFMYVISFIILSISMARSYRCSFIETQGGLKNVFAHKVFCGWDYSIATKEAALLKSSSIYRELKELLSDTVKSSYKEPLLKRFWTRVVQVVVNITVAFMLIGTGYIMWSLLNSHGAQISKKESATQISIVIAVTINFVMVVFPALFSYIVDYEDYKHPRAALYITLIRTFLLMTVVMGVFLAFWLTHSSDEKCWETSIGQHIYRLILFDFLFSVIGMALMDTTRYLISKKFWPNLGASNFDIAKHSLSLIYNQTLFWVGLYFSPLLSLVVVLKQFLTWYIRRTCLLSFCQPSVKSWRAAQTYTWFFIISFLSLFLVLIAHGYIIVKITTSDCGPLSNFPHMYEMILKGIFHLEQNNIFLKLFAYLLKPGTVALILVGMCVVVYYLREKANAQQAMVDILRNMLVLEAKDKEFLLKNISKVTEGQWQYNLQKEWHEPDHIVEGASGDDISSGSDTYMDSATPSSSSLFLPTNSDMRLNYHLRKKI